MTTTERENEASGMMKIEWRGVEERAQKGKNVDYRRENKESYEYLRV